MITTMHALLTDSFVAPDGECVYIIRSGEDVMYVGRTIDPNKRMKEHYRSTFYGFALNDKRDVWRWTVELRTAQECQEYIPEQYTYIDIYVAETNTIIALRPVLNAIYNLNRSPMPERYKHLFEIEVGVTDNLF